MLMPLRNGNPIYNRKHDCNIIEFELEMMLCKSINKQR